MTKRTLKKIVANLDPDAWHGHATETMWAERVDEARYKLRSVPFYARGLSVEDIVRTEKHDSVDVIIGVIIHGGHSTYRIFLGEGIAPESDTFSQYWEPLATVGCTFERATKRLLAVDIPPFADIHHVYAALEEGEAAGIWDFEEGSIAPSSLA
jgi:hypothetical protein